MKVLFENYFGQKVAGCLCHSSYLVICILKISLKEVKISHIFSELKSTGLNVLQKPIPGNNMLGVLKDLVVCIPACSLNDIRWGYNMDTQLRDV